MPPPEGTPWWGWLLYGVIVIAIPGILVALIQQHRKVAEVVDQVKNTHVTNLRSDIDDTKADARAAKESAHRLERFVEELVASIRAMEQSMDRREMRHISFEAESRDDRQLIRADLDAFRTESAADRKQLHRDLRRLAGPAE